jgi:hypothetical protein
VLFRSHHDKAGAARTSLYLAIVPRSYHARRPAPRIRRLSRRAQLTWTHDAKDGVEVVVEHKVGDEPWMTAVESRATPLASIKTEPNAEVGWLSDDLLPGDHAFRLRYGPVADATYSAEVRLTMEMEAPYEVQPPAPNPVRVRATLRVGVRDAQNVRAEVYDMLGRRIAVLYDGRLDAGQTHMLLIDTAALQLTSGVYLIRIAGESFAETQRMTVVR